MKRLALLLLTLTLRVLCLHAQVGFPVLENAHCDTIILNETCFGYAIIRNNSGVPVYVSGASGHISTCQVTWPREAFLPNTDMRIEYRFAGTRTIRENRVITVQFSNDSTANIPVDFVVLQAAGTAQPQNTETINRSLNPGTIHFDHLIITDTIYFDSTNRTSYPIPPRDYYVRFTNRGRTPVTISGVAQHDPAFVSGYPRQPVGQNKTGCIRISFPADAPFRHPTNTFTIRFDNNITEYIVVKRVFVNDPKKAKQQPFSFAEQKCNCDSIFFTPEIYTRPPKPLPPVTENPVTKEEKCPCALDFPVPPGGMSFNTFSDSLVKLTQKKIKPKKTGRVVIKFRIDSLGNVIDASIVRSVDSSFEAALLRNLPRMGKWTPTCKGPIAEPGFDDCKRRKPGISPFLQLQLNVQGPESATAAPQLAHCDTCPCNHGVPEYPGGNELFCDSVVKLTKQKVKPQNPGICYVQFTITADGSLVDPVIMKSFLNDPKLEAELLKNLTKPGKWIPACSGSTGWEPDPEQPPGRGAERMSIILPFKFTLEP